MEILIQAVKMLLVVVFAISGLFVSYAPEGGDFPPSGPVPAGDQTKYLQITAEDVGFDMWNPVKDHGGYRYGPSMILNTDGSLDVWCAANGPGDLVDLVAYRRLWDGGRKSSKEVVALKPTAGAYDGRWTCDPGVVKFGGYYYIGYTTTLDERGVANVMCVGRSKTPYGPYEKWTGSGWGAEPQPVVDYTGDPEQWGVGEPAFVVKDDTLFVYYSWCDENGCTTRVATADATDENWPATLVERGTCIPAKDGGDSADVKYADEFGRFVAVYTEKRFSDDSYVAVWESFDGITFRQSGFVKANTARQLHNCGISGRADGHIGVGDPVYLSYAYSGAGGSWGNWSTRLHTVKLSLSDAPADDPDAVRNADTAVTHKKMRLIPEIITVKAEKQSYTLEEKSQKVWAMALDSDGFVFPVFFGVTFDGYDPAVVEIKGGRLYPVGAGTTRVYLHWHGFSGDFTVTVK